MFLNISLVLVKTTEMRSLTIELMGMPKSGKTTQMDILGSNLQHAQGYKVRCIHEGARISPLDKEDYFMFNSWSFHNTLNRIKEILASIQSKIKI